MFFCCQTTESNLAIILQIFHLKSAPISHLLGCFRISFAHRSSFLCPYPTAAPPKPRGDLPFGQDGLSHCVPGTLPTAFWSAAIWVRWSGVHILRTFINMTVWAISINHFFWLLLFCGLLLVFGFFAFCLCCCYARRDIVTFGGTKEKQPIATDGDGWIAACKIANLNIFTLPRYFLRYAVGHLCGRQGVEGAVPNGSRSAGDQTTKRFRMLMNAQIQQTNLNDSRSQSRRCRSPKLWLKSWSWGLEPVPIFLRL